MTDSLFNFPAPFSQKAKKDVVSIVFTDSVEFPSWLEKQSEYIQTQIKNDGFTAQPKQTTILKNKYGHSEIVVGGLSSGVHYLDSAATAQYIQNNFSNDFIDNHAFEITSKHKENVINKIAIGWGLSAYHYDAFKSEKKSTPILTWPAKADKKEVTATIESLCLLKNLINTPPNVLGTDELANVAKNVAKAHKAKIKIIHDKDLLKKNFPLIYNVGKASPRPPQLVDMSWGNSKHPKVTIVGKGIIYDTGGLNLKPGQYMRDMKKDMGGAAHALGVAWMIMSLNLPVNLRVILPIAENSVSGNSFRPGDVIISRKGLSVEIDDTDAEGRLVVGDALAYASEDKPDLLIDFCTLTGAARVALGFDIPAFFSNRETIINSLRVSSLEQDDAVWPLPLWAGYEREMDSSVADLINSGTGRAGAIHGGLFLQRFIDPEIDWIHLDCYAWEQAGKAGRPKGGADTGMRAITDFIRQRYKG